MNPPKLVSCFEYYYPFEYYSPESGQYFQYDPDCPDCVAVNAEAIEEYRLYLAREARDRRTGCIGVVIAAVLFWSAIIGGFYALLS